MAARSDLILPYLCCTELRSICSSDLDTILVTSLDLILNQMRLIIVNFNAHLVQVKRISYDNCLDIKISVDCCTSTEVDLVALDPWSALLALNIDTVGVTGDDLIVLNDDFVLRAGLNHDTTGFEMLEVASFDLDVGIDSYETCCTGVVGGIALQLAVKHLDTCAFEDGDAGHLTICLTEYSTKK